MPTLFRKLICLLAVTTFVLSVKPTFAQGLLFSPPPDKLSPLEDLGQEIFNDTNLSRPTGQGCVSCHDPNAGFTSPDSMVNSLFGPHFGAVEHRFGPRKPPTTTYAGESGNLRFVGPDPFGNDWAGGLFWDGRAAGYYPLMPRADVEFDPLAEQAMAPFLNIVEQNLPSEKALIRKITNAPYRDKFLHVYGPDSLDFEEEESEAKVETAYDQVVTAIAAFERSSKVSPYTSKFDFWLKGQAELTPKEKLGLWLMENPSETSMLDEPPRGGTAENQGQAQCGLCHLTTMRMVDGELLPPLFTDFKYHNTGLPKNPNNPFYFMPEEINPVGEDFIDRGLAVTLESYLGTSILGTEVTQDHVDQAEGKFKTPTLRNVNKRPMPSFVKAYGHSGVLKSLKEVVHFYNTRDVPGEFPEPEVSANITTFIIGDLGLTDEEEDAIVAFLATLSDGYDPNGGGHMPPPQSPPPQSPPPPSPSRQP